jgi:D-lactate dehydrogenase (cytochrome)
MADIGAVLVVPTGYDLKNLLIGSEGTLGIITELSIRLFGQPEAVSSAVCEFPTLADAVKCTSAIIQVRNAA